MTGNGGSAASKHVKSHFRKLHDATKGLHKLRLIEWSAAGTYNILHINEAMKNPYTSAHIHKLKMAETNFWIANVYLTNTVIAITRRPAGVKQAKSKDETFPVAEEAAANYLRQLFPVAVAISTTSRMPNAERRKLFVFPDWATDAVRTVCPTRNMLEIASNALLKLERRLPSEG